MPTCPFCQKEVPAGASICPHCLRALPLSVTTARPVLPASPVRVMHRWLRPMLFLVALLAVGAYGLREYRSRRATPEPVLREAGEEAPVTGPVTTTIAPPLDVRIADTASAAIAAGGHLAYTFSGGGRSGCRVHGTVRALSGGDRRVNVFVVDRDGLADVDAGKVPRTYYESGPVSDIALDISLDGRTEYTLIVANPGHAKRPTMVRVSNVTASCAD